MNREIKFRIWHLDKKKWLTNNDYIGINNFGVVVDDRDDMYNLSLADGCIIQQYTGLKDKNGKDIYEGDLVLSTCSEILNDNFSGEVIFDEGSFLVKIDDTDIRGVSDELEIVGNIFENKELLNQ